MAPARGDDPDAGSPLGPEAVDAAIERITERDPALGRDAEAAAMQLTAGEGAEVISQAHLQDDLWWRVPKQYPPDSWFDIAAGAAALFDELGLDRYAELARSATTTEILEAWAEGPEAGHARAMAARDASGVAAPDTHLHTWGRVFGSIEAQAMDAVERGLEAAVVAGDLVPGARRARAVAVDVTERVLQAPLDLPPGQTLLTMVTTERVETWLVTTSDPELQARRQQVVNQLLGPVDPPEGVDDVVAPLRWLLDHAGEGIDLTQSGYLARTMVVDGAERFGWWDWDKPPRSEADLHQLGELREMATRLRLVRRKGRTLQATSAGRASARDPERLWRLVVSTLGGPDEFDHVMAELVGLCLLDGPSEGNSLVATIRPMLSALGWRAEGGDLTDREAQSAVWDRLRWWTAIGVVDGRPSRWDRETHREVMPSSEWLTDAGRATVLAYLRERATRPRTDPYG